MTQQLLHTSVASDGVVQLTMPDQNFAEPFHDDQIQTHASTGFTPSRLFAFAVPLISSALLGYVLLHSLGTTAMGLLLVAAVIIPFFWSVVAAMLAVIGCFRREQKTAEAGQSLHIALLVLLFDEAPDAVMHRAVNVLASLNVTSRHRFTLRILSDSRQDLSMRREQDIFSKLKKQHANLDMAYRHRPENLDYKSGNIRAWIQSEGHLHDAMLVLDADSVMTPETIIALTDALSADRHCALMQSLPRVLKGKTLWQNTQAFASEAYGINSGRGLAMVSDTAANSYGHNVLIRTKAFAACAGLPHLTGEPPFGGVIMSHDFVEAALLRRAGWSVRFLPDHAGSFEDTPASLISYLQRDRRWCHGNLQHLRLLTMPGLNMMSRFHLLQGAMTYLTAPLWLLAVLIWSLMPIETSTGNMLLVNLSIIAVLLVPRLCGLLSTLRDGSRHRFTDIAQELLVSSLVAPTLMVQRSVMIASILRGTSSVWRKHTTQPSSWKLLAHVHRVEICIGLCLALAFAAEIASSVVWLTALPLLAAPALNDIVSRASQEQQS
jgi:membrane glycosyltransferase